MKTVSFSSRREGNNVMTEKQRRFADYFIQTGNATEAARKAGYSKKNIGENAAKTLKNPKVSAYIEEQISGLSADRIANAQEVMEVFSSIMRGNIRDFDGSPVSIRDRLEAGKALIRRYERLEDRETGADALARAKDVLGTIESVIN